VQLAKGQPEAPRRRQHHLGQQRRAVAGEQPVKCTTDAIVAQPSSLRRVDVEQPGGEAHRALLLAIHRLALDDDRTQQHAQSLRMGGATAAVGGGHMALEQFGQPDAAQEVIDQR
jgi:uncharacterized protein (DUF58 family)